MPQLGGSSGWLGEASGWLAFAKINSVASARLVLHAAPVLMTTQSTPNLEAPATKRFHAQESDRIPVEKDVMVWARESARLDEEAAAKKIGVSLATLQSWENGTKFPTNKQLRKAAHVYRRPSTALLSREPQKDFAALPDYRAAEIVDPAGLSHELTIEIRRAHVQRKILLEIREFAPLSAPEIVALPEIAQEDDPEQIGKLLRDYLGFSEVTPCSTGAGYDSLREWISAIEARGILVLHLRNADPDEVAGFSISAVPYPAIAINGEDPPRRRLFALLHELAHVALSLGGVCDLHEVTPGGSKRLADKLETRCNEIAAATLMPAEKLRELPELADPDKHISINTETLRKLSQPFGVSSEVFLLRLVSLGLTSWEDYWEVQPRLLKLYMEGRVSEKQKQETSGGPSYYQVKALTLGHGYVASVLNAYNAGAITTTETARDLEVVYYQVPKLALAVA